MRDQDDNIRLYAPLVRRIIILLAAIITVPVVLWTITVFMRTYVAAPAVPTFRPMAAVAVSAAPDNNAAAAATASAASSASRDAAPAQPSAPIVVAKATTTDAAPFVAAPAAAATTGSLLNTGNANAPTGGVSVAMATPAVPGPAQSPAAGAAPVQGGAAAPSQVTGTTPNAWPSPDAQPQPASSDQVADALPDVPPLSGPIPLPHPRPHFLALAQNGLPMPRARPSAVIDSDGTPAATAGPLDWLGNIFHQGQQSQQQQ